MTDPCPCCEQPLPDLGFRLYAPTSAAVRGDRAVFLSAQQFRLLNYMVEKRRPVRRVDLRDNLYTSRRNGGPLTADKVVHVQVYKLNAKLKPLGIKLTGRNCGEDSYYRLHVGSVGNS